MVLGRAFSGLGTHEAQVRRGALAPERSTHPVAFLTTPLAQPQPGDMVAIAALVLGALLAQDVFELLNRKSR